MCLTISARTLHVFNSATSNLRFPVSPFSSHCVLEYISNAFGSDFSDRQQMISELTVAHMHLTCRPCFAPFFDAGV